MITYNFRIYLIHLTKNHICDKRVDERIGMTLFYEQLNLTLSLSIILFNTRWERLFFLYYIIWSFVSITP